MTARFKHTITVLWISETWVVERIVKPVHGESSNQTRYDRSRPSGTAPVFRVAPGLKGAVPDPPRNSTCAAPALTRLGKKGADTAARKASSWKSR